MCLLKSGYFEQIEEGQQQQHQPSTHANNLICTWYEEEKEAYELQIPNHLIIVPFCFSPSQSPLISVKPPRLSSPSQNHHHKSSSNTAQR